jgi:hypothetical protein
MDLLIGLLLVIFVLVVDISSSDGCKLENDTTAHSDGQLTGTTDLLRDLLTEIRLFVLAVEISPSDDCITGMSLVKSR